MNAKILCSSSTKGGVAKTTLVKYLSIIARAQGEKVLIIDMCQNGDIATRLGYKYNQFTYYIQNWLTDSAEFTDVVCVDDKTGIHFLPANEDIEEIIPYISKTMPYDYNLALVKKIETIKHLYTYIFIDTHPSEANTLLSLGLLAADLVLIPTVLDYSSVSAMERTINLIKLGESIGKKTKYVIVGMNIDTIKRRKRIKELNKYLLEEYGVTEIPIVQRSVTVEDADFTGENLNEKTSSYAKKIMNQFEIVFEVVKGELY